MKKGVDICRDSFYDLQNVKYVLGMDENL